MDIAPDELARAARSLALVAASGLLATDVQAAYLAGVVCGLRTALR